MLNHLLLVVQRSLTVIRVSPTLPSSSSKQKNQETNSNYFCTNGNSNNSNMSYNLYLVGIGSKGGEITLCNEDGVAIEQAHEPYNFMLDTSKNVTNCGVVQENLPFLTSRMIKQLDYVM